VDLTEVCYAGGRWVKVAGDRMKCWTLRLLVLSLQAVLSVGIITGYRLGDL
jgi:hypothetical protein